MEFRLIRVFCAVYEEGSINKAAARLRIAQPSISVAIRNLETDLHVELFERSATGAAPTAQAHVLYERLQKVLADLDAARKAVAGNLKDIRGPLRVGLPPIVVKGLLPDFLPQFLDRYPDVELRITEGMPQRLIDMTLGNELDMAITLTPPVDSRLVSQWLGSEPIVLISAKDNTTLPRGKVDLAKLSSLKLALPWSMHSVRSNIERYLRLEEMPVTRQVELDTVYSVLDLVRRSDWVTIFPISALGHEHQDIVAREIASPEMTAEFFMIRPARNSPPAAAKIFLEEIEKGFDRIARTWRASHLARDD